MSDSLYWFATDKSANEFRAALADADRKVLERMLFNARYNDFCSARANVDDEQLKPIVIKRHGATGRNLCNVAPLTHRREHERPN